MTASVATVTPPPGGGAAPGRVAPSAGPSAAEAGAGRDDPTRLLTAALCVLVATLPLAYAEPLWSTPGGEGDWNRSVLVAPFDLALAAVAVLSVRVPGAWRALFARPFVRAGAGVYGVGFAVALVAHPTPLGLALGLRLGAGLAVVAAATEVLGRRRSGDLVLAVTAATGVAQAVLAMVQSARGDSFGVSLVDFDGPLYPFGSSFAGRGGLPHPYHLAVVLVVAQGAALLGLRRATSRWPWLVALVTIGAGIGVTYTRAGLLGQLALLGVALVARKAGPTRLAAAAVAAGLVLGGTAFGDGWVTKAEVTADTSANPTSSRTERLREASGLVRDHPVTGVGPGRYVSALAETDAPEMLPAHNLLAHEAAELGVVGLVGAGLLAAALAWRTLRGGAWRLMVALPMAPFLLLDAYPYVFATGLAASAVWLALVVAAGRDDANPTAAAPA